MKKVLAPHKEQDGWVYWRVNPRRCRNLGIGVTFTVSRRGCEESSHPVYHDDRPGSRIISSRRVEEAVETYDFLKLCADEGLVAQIANDLWIVWLLGKGIDGPDGRGKTLREAYYRYHAEVDR